MKVEWLGLAACGLTTAACGDVIDFENLAVGTNVTTQYQGQGVTFASVPNPGSGNTATIHSFAIFGARALGPGGPAPVFGGTLIVHFSPAVSEAGCWVLDHQSPTTVTAYDAGGAVVGTAPLAGPSAESWSLAHAGGIVRIEIVPTSNTDGWVIDDLTFTPMAACYPDCDGDGALTLADFGCFQTKFALGDPYADCNGDTVLNLADFGCFQTSFALGCP